MQPSRVISSTERPASTPRIELVIPVYNERLELASSVRRLRHYLDTEFPFSTVITIADNASTDGTWDIASHLAAELDGVRAVHLDQKGRGRALRAVWTASHAEVVAYMDVDLATGLDALLPLVAPLLSGHSDVAIGTRLAGGSRVIRGPRREAISRIYNLIVHLLLGNHFSDAQCGFKAVRNDVAQALLPLIDDEEWFFDTELLVLAERNGLRIHEVPVDWVDDPDSRVDVTRTAIKDLRGIARMQRSLVAGRGVADLPGGGRRLVSSPVGRFAGIGVMSTVAYLIVFLLLRQALSEYGASALALLACTAANTAAHLRLSARAAKDRRSPVLRAGAIGLGINLVATTAGLLVAHAVGRHSELDDVVAVLISLGPAALARLLIVRAAATVPVRSPLPAEHK
jgi:glycosyltransferase involved in cell wall biosynthesis